MNNPFDTLAHYAFMRGRKRLGIFFLSLANIAEGKRPGGAA